MAQNIIFNKYQTTADIGQGILGKIAEFTKPFLEVSEASTTLKVYVRSQVAIRLNFLTVDCSARISNLILMDQGQP